MEKVMDILQATFRLKIRLLMLNLLAPTAMVAATPPPPPLELAIEVADEISDELIGKLHAERSRVVFLDISRCSLAVGWCEVFFGRLQAQLNNQKIRFLSGAVTAQIRSKIAEEQVYQQASQMVDIERAVELGQQDAFHAFVTLSISGDENAGFINIQGQSIHIASASVTIAIFRTITVGTIKRRSWGQLLGGAFFLGLGAYGAYSFNEIAILEKGRSEAAFEFYEKADNAKDAAMWRQKVESHDERYKRAQNAYIGSLVISGISLLYMLKQGETRYRYRLVSEQRSSQGRDRRRKFSVAPIVDRAPGLALNWEL